MNIGCRPNTKWKRKGAYGGHRGKLNIRKKTSETLPLSLFLGIQRFRELLHILVPQSSSTKVPNKIGLILELQGSLIVHMLPYVPMCTQPA